MYFLLETATGKFPTYFVAVYVIGFIAAVTIGSLAWYNSKRPAGWENSDRPDFVPKLDVEEQPLDQSKKLLILAKTAHLPLKSL